MAEYATYPSLRGKVVLMTSGAEGIGTAAVELFCVQGSRVVFLDIADEYAARLVDKLSIIHGIAVPKFVHCDVTDLD
ncbi:hypothetical protein EsDP_00007090 [Epichloe bromicola]|uniref:Uncharacterized protein n=1 Tax=Epichloe bromicola TaxID=79588 RepID=A0ABQ0CZJ1_9HYPO